MSRRDGLRAGCDICKRAARGSQVQQGGGQARLNRRRESERFAQRQLVWKRQRNSGTMTEVMNCRRRRSALTFYGSRFKSASSVEAAPQLRQQWRSRSRRQGWSLVNCQDNHLHVYTVHTCCTRYRVSVSVLERRLPEIRTIHTVRRTTSP